MSDQYVIGIILASIVAAMIVAWLEKIPAWQGAAIAISYIVSVEIITRSSREDLGFLPVIGALIVSFVVGSMLKLSWKRTSGIVAAFSITALVGFIMAAKYLGIPLEQL